jgi:phosphohistidine phosphatase SixA
MWKSEDMILAMKYRSIPATAQSKNVPQLVITRHAESCNNINEGKLFGKDWSPSLSDFGIKSGLLIGEKESKYADYQGDYVLVSSLIRTWETATLLYGNKPLNLLIFPYLKERAKYGFLMRGNMHKNFRHAAAKYLHFYNENKLKINVTISFFDTSTQEIHKLFETKDGKCSCTNIIRWDNQKKMDAYQGDGNIGEFINLLQQTNQFKNTQVLHAVSHNGVMKQWIRKQNFEEKPKTNLWRIEIDHWTSDDRKTRIVKPLEHIRIDKTASKNKLCGNRGSVDSSTVCTICTA